MKQLMDSSLFVYIGTGRESDLTDVKLIQLMLRIILKHSI